MSRTTRTGGLLLLMLAAALSGCERPPVESRQIGYRGTGMEQTSNPRILQAQREAQPAVPQLPPGGSDDGPKAKDVYKNVKVLGDLSVAEFTRQMVAITQWVSPQQGCTYCHGSDLADDSLYTKVVARRMIEMNRHLNVDWTQHVGGTGVTCYTCHRGQPVPAQVWFKPADRKYAANSVMGDLAGQNLAARSVGLTSLPFDPFTPYLLEDKPIRVIGDTALKMTGAAANRKSTKQAEHTYALMVHMSESLGVNCTQCHNTRNFQGWSDAPPQRTTAWHGIRMARDLNVAYLEPLTKTFPAKRLGVHGDVAKVNCSTCHQGVNKPMGGLAMAKNWPGLMTTAVSVPVAAAATVPVAAVSALPLKAIMYFAVNSPGLQGEEAAKLDKLVAAMKEQVQTTATISGYHSASGTLAANQQLAKQRAFTIRDALLAGGVAADRIKLDKPLQAEANIKGEDPMARRVEVTVN
jgi:photosynthetic reaction center cytochrome c subunit